MAINQPKTIQERMTLEDAMRIGDIMEADDVISVVAMSSRRLTAEVRSLEQQIAELKLECATWRDKTGD